MKHTHFIRTHFSDLLQPFAHKTFLFVLTHPCVVLPRYDPRVRELLDFSIYLDISDEIKFAWKIQRDMKERGHSLESIQASIEARKPDFDKVWEAPTQRTHPP